MRGQSVSKSACADVLKYNCVDKKRALIKIKVSGAASTADYFGILSLTLPALGVLVVGVKPGFVQGSGCGPFVSWLAQEST